MNLQHFWQAGPKLAATLTLLTLVACSASTTTSNSSSSEGKTKFLCVQDDQNRWVTIAQRNNLKTIKPLLIWQTKEFGDNWTPKKRCHHVTEKLNKAVANNGGFLGNLALKDGKVGNYTVICVATREDCTADNMLFTLKRENASKPQEVLAKIAGFARNEASFKSIWESGQSYLLLEDLVNNAFGKSR